MAQYLVKLETVSRRAPLGLRFIDMARGLLVGAGLAVSAWPLGAPGLARQAASSPVSGAYGFRALPGLRRYAEEGAPASEWCAPPPPLPPDAEDLQDIGDLRALVRTSAGATPNFALLADDPAGRFLPAALLMCLPRERLVEVPLFSGPARPAPPGAGVVRGELWDQLNDRPAAWAVVAASTGGSTSYLGVADARGMVRLFVPYAAALPPLAGDGQGSGPLDQLSWPLTVQVFYQPLQQRPVPGVSIAPAPPDLRSILEQAAARIFNGGAGEAPLATVTRQLRLGVELELRTGVEPAWLPRLLIERAV